MDKVVLGYMFEVISGNKCLTDSIIEQYSGDKYTQTILIGLKSIQNTLEQKDAQIKQLKEQNSDLIIELNDRVKNNMQVVSSLLSLQADYVDNAETKSLIRYCQYRLKSMSMVHEMLYRSDDLSKIRYAEYIKMLVHHLTVTMKGHDHNIRFRLELSPIMLNIDTAIPLGLLLNEIITNSLKYGIKGNQHGEIFIKLQQSKFPNFILHIGDDGVGFENDADFRTSETLGLLLIHKLTLQLKGNIEKDNSKPGTNFIITFQQIG